MTRTINTLLWLLVAALAVRLGLSAFLPMADTTEPRYAEIARTMAETGDWITPWFDTNVPFWGKPPLSFWLQAVSFKLLGVNEFAARLPSWLANLAVVWLIYRTRRGLHPAPDSPDARERGLWAALIYATTVLGFVSAGTVMTDSFLALGTTLTLSGLILRLQGGHAAWGWVFFLGLVVGLLAKGPVAVVLTGVPVFFWALLTGQWKTLWQRLPWLYGTVATAILVLPWYILAEIKTPGFLDYFIVGEHFKRFLVSDWAGDLYGGAHEYPRGTIWLYLLGASLPWLPLALWAAVRRRWKAPANLGAWQGQSRGVTGLVIGAALTPAVFFTFSGNILWTYVLPGLPFLAVLAAGVMAPPALENTRLRIRPLVAAGVFMMPVLGTLATGWLVLNPDDLNTEMAMIQRTEQRPSLPDVPVTYLDRLPFSARFYGEGKVRLIQPDQLQQLLANGAPAEPLLLAVPRRERAWRDKLATLGSAIDQNRRFILFHLPAAHPSAGAQAPTTAHSLAQPTGLIQGADNV
ncbi:ArnT family glycosyltransferase [Marinobacter sp. C2H3]|uniref:ArnT family glycosyltransferase n=1 Tax=Marinobacter sp. C2H3 TaxID=3119003 RepID=UPI00300EAE9A